MGAAVVIYNSIGLLLVWFVVKPRGVLCIEFDLIWWMVLVVIKKQSSGKLKPKRWLSSLGFEFGVCGGKEYWW